MRTTTGRSRLWAEVARAGFREHAAYRTATMAGVFTNCVFGFLRVAVLLAALRAATGGEIAGYDADQAVTYVWLGQGMLAVIAIWNWADIASRIPTGEIATDLLRPADFQLWWLARDYGRAAFHVLARGVPPVVVGAVITGILAPAPGRVVPFVMSIMLAVAVSFGLRFIANLAVFWTMDWRGVSIASNVLMTIGSGLVLPVGFYPEWAATLLRALPWYGALQAPLDTYLGRGSAVGIVGSQVLWVALLLLGGRVVLAAATRRVVVQGG